MKTPFKKILFALLMAILLVPLIPAKWSTFSKTVPLAGEALIFKMPSFSFSGYFSRAYQDSFSDYFSHTFHNRAFYIRAYNEINYDLLRFPSSSSGIIIGKKDFLFLRSYVDNYIGSNCLGKRQIEKNVGLLKKIQDSLKRKNIDLIILFTPGKASFYSEYLPDKYLENKKDSNNYLLYSSELIRQGINFIDLNKYFKILKSKSKYPLFSVWGTHWTHYGMSIGADTVIKYIEKIRAIKMPDFDYSSIKVSTDIQKPDYDVEDLLNLYFPLAHTPLAYPNYSYKRNPTNYKPSVLVIGDSYWGNLCYKGIPQNVFKQDIFWRYFKDEYINNIRQKTPVLNLNIKEKILQQDVIIIEATEENYNNFPYGFSEHVDFLFQKEKFN